MKLFELFSKKPLRFIAEGIDHPEDTIISSGSQGAERVVNELLNLQKNPETISIKWDGFPAVVFGRDNTGNLVFVDKHMYDKVVKGKMDFTTIAEYDAERGVNRSNLWESEKTLRPILDKIVPRINNTYYMGDLMWTGTPKEVDGYYAFKPNTVEYRVKKDSELGKIIADSQGGIAVHTYIPGLGQNDQPLVGLKGLPEDGGITFLVGEIKDKPTVSIDKNTLKETQETISKYKDTVDKFIADLTALKAKSVLTAMSPFITQMLDEGDIGTDIIPRFLNFLESKLSPAAATKLLGKNRNGWLYQSDGGAPGLLGIWSMWAAITELKMHVKKQIDSQIAGSEVRALINGVDSHEGYVFGSGKDKLKLVDRLGFTAAHFAKFKVPDDEIQRKSKMPMAAFCFGRMNPPTIGHELVMHKTVETGGKNSFIFLSNSVDNESNPLDPKTKAEFIAKIYPQLAKHIVKDAVQNPIYAANWLYDHGFRNMTFIAGSDRLGNSPGSIEKVLTAWNSGPVRTNDNARGPNGREHVILHFVSSGSRDPDAEGVTGISGSLARKFAAEGNKEGFTKATGVSDNIKVNGKTLYQAVREGMGITDIVDEPKAKKAAAKPAKKSPAQTIKTSKKTELAESQHGVLYFKKSMGIAKTSTRLNEMRSADFLNELDFPRKRPATPSSKIARDTDIGNWTLQVSKLPMVMPAVTKGESKFVAKLTHKRKANTFIYGVGDTQEEAKANAVAQLSPAQQDAERTYSSITADLNAPFTKEYLKGDASLWFRFDKINNETVMIMANRDYVNTFGAAIKELGFTKASKGRTTSKGDATPIWGFSVSKPTMQKANLIPNMRYTLEYTTDDKDGNAIFVMNPDSVTQGPQDKYRMGVPGVTIAATAINEDYDDWEDIDYGQSEYLHKLLSDLDAGDAEGVEYYYQTVIDEISEASLVRAIANHIDPEIPAVKDHLMKLLLNIMKNGGDAGVVSGLIEAIRWHVDWPELAVIEKSLKADLKEDKIKGADGKACWKGYRYAGTEKGKDNCVKVKKAKR